MKLSGYEVGEVELKEQKNELKEQKDGGFEEIMKH